MTRDIYATIPSVPKEYWEDRDWAYDNYNKLAKSYPDQWVAIVDKEVVASGKNGTEVITIAKQKTGRKDFPVIFVESGIRVY